MSDLENQKSNVEEKKPQTGQYDPLEQTQFVRERIKQKPVNKRKLLHRTLTTVIMAAVFGMVACLTFLLLEPIINNWLNPKEHPQQIILQEETEEVLPEDLYVDDSQMMEEESYEIITDASKNLTNMIADIKTGTDFYEQMYEEIKKLVDETNRAVVSVSAVTSDVDWFQNPYENINSSSGIIVGNNGRQFFILVNDRAFQQAENIEVQFCDESVAGATFVGKDAQTGLAVVSVEVAELTENTMDHIGIAKLGSSNNSSLKGTPVVAIGTVSGMNDSYSLGMITTVGIPLGIVDADYKKMKTDIYGSSSATGILVNMKGLVLGLINQSYAEADTKNLISAIGITELKRMIEKLSNSEARVYLGLYGADIPEQVRTERRIPEGVYVSAVEMDSPAMKAGLLSGDIICKMNVQDIRNYRELVYYLNNCKPDQTVMVTVLRQNMDAYVELEIPILLEALE